MTGSLIRACQFFKCGMRKEDINFDKLYKVNYFFGTADCSVEVYKDKRYYLLFGIYNRETLYLLTPITELQLLKIINNDLDIREYLEESKIFMLKKEDILDASNIIEFEKSELPNTIYPKQFISLSFHTDFVEPFRKKLTAKLRKKKIKNLLNE